MKREPLQIPLETQWAMHDFFMKTSAPRLLNIRKAVESKKEEKNAKAGA